ncbi:MAG: DUF2334 domain-containing protein [Chloroflexota bacterium]
MTSRGQDADARRVVVSIHDVAPSTASETRRLLERLDALGVGPRVLKVVPRWEDREDLAADDALCDLLRAEAARGTEIVLHGWTHRLDGPPRGPRAERWRVRLFAPYAAELAALTEPAAMRALVERGLAVFRALGLQATGFCPPAWISDPALDPAIGAAGIRYVLRMTEIHDLTDGRRLRVPSAGFMGVGGRYETGVEIQRDLILRRPRPPRTVRLFLHPQGASGSAACNRTLDRLAQLLRTHRPVTYSELLWPTPS